MLTDYFAFYSVAEVTKDKVERFLNRIAVVYSNVDADFFHGNKIGNNHKKVTLIQKLQCEINMSE